MPFDFAALKASVRQVVHDTLGVEALYIDDTLVSPVVLRVRFHTQINRFGDMLDQGWAEVVEGVNRLIFNIPELTEKAVIPARGAVITFPDWDDVSLVLHTKEPGAGPIEQIWQVTQQ